MNSKSVKSVGVLLLVALMVLSASPAFGLGREGRGASFMRAFGMTRGYGSVNSYGIWSSRLSAKAGVQEVGPVMAAYSDNFDNLQLQPGWLSNLFSFGGTITIQGVSYTFLPYGYYGYRK